MFEEHLFQAEWEGSSRKNYFTYTHPSWSQCKPLLFYQWRVACIMAVVPILLQLVAPLTLWAIGCNSPSGLQSYILYRAVRFFHQDYVATLAGFCSPPESRSLRTYFGIVTGKPGSNFCSAMGDLGPVCQPKLPYRVVLKERGRSLHSTLTCSRGCNTKPYWKAGGRVYSWKGTTSHLKKYMRM